MELTVLIIIAIWAGVTGWHFGWSRGLERGRREQTMSFKGQEVMITLQWKGIERLLDERGMVAMPKGVDFSNRKDAACN